MNVNITLRPSGRTNMDFLLFDIGINDSINDGAGGRIRTALESTSNPANPV
jgi:hypothetical protein